MRLLGIDLGKVRIGVAVAETGLGLATPRPVLPASGTLARDADAIIGLARKEEADAVVVGVPGDPESNAMARVCAKLADLLRERGATVHTVDETLTSAAAEETLRSHGLTAAGVRKRVDSEAAALILERYMRSHEDPA